MKKLKVVEKEENIRSSRTSSGSSSLLTTSISITPSSSKESIAGRPKVQLSEFEQDLIRLIFDQLLNEKVYPTVSNMLNALLTQGGKFSTQSKTSLGQQMKIIGFKCKQTAQTQVFLGSESFQARRACYFRKLDELRSANSILC
ncbi:unnamed protein product [Rotaria socialis]|uniref:Uncharacterized protein n=1 Tax=Rotaria socialis TaxID=392032 RepID=A0A819AE97_9BILA|nr:unnamed protein product [Rotaria socialis]